MPDTYSELLWGGWYINSAASGHREDFIVKDLVSAIDSSYGTVASRNGRGIAGHSMGGYGALSLAMRHPDEISEIKDPSALNKPYQRFFIAVAAAFSPNPDWPVRGDYFNSAAIPRYVP